MRFDAVGTGGEALASRGEWSTMAEEGISSAAESPFEGQLAISNGRVTWVRDVASVCLMGMSQADRSLTDSDSALRRYSSPQFAKLCRTEY